MKDDPPLPSLAKLDEKLRAAEAKRRKTKARPDEQGQGLGFALRIGTEIVAALIVGVAINAGKGPMFGISDRIGMVKEWADNLPDRKLADRIVVQSMDGLLVHYAEKNGATCIVRGLRAVTDFDYEFQMTGMNSRLNDDIETVFLMASERCQFISSRFVKEIGRLGGDISSFVSAPVAARLRDRFDVEQKTSDGPSRRRQTFKDEV
jgi:pantetheine-phosphate adenylyltransferase